MIHHPIEAPLGLGSRVEEGFWVSRVWVRGEGEGALARAGSGEGVGVGGEEKRE